MTSTKFLMKACVIMVELLAVGIGGCLGSCLRYAFNKLTENFALIPLGTLLSNVIAGFFIGFIIGLEQQSVKISNNTKLFLTTGLMGGLSTFSTFSLETINLFKAGKYLSAGGNIVLNLALSLAGTVLGMLAAKIFVKT